MLLTHRGRFNAVLGLATCAAFLGADVAAADEIRRWRDADGQIHVEIVGSGDPVDPDAAGMPLLSTTELSPDEKFSIATSGRRREIEKSLKAASADLAGIEADIEKTEREQFVVYTPPTARSPAEAQFLLDAQRNAFLAAQRFRQDREDRLRKLRRERRRRLAEITDLWERFDELREEVQERYGEKPGWWRDQLGCEGCLTAAAAAAALADPDEEEDLPEKRRERDDRRDPEEAKAPQDPLAPEHPEAPEEWREQPPPFGDDG